MGVPLLQEHVRDRRPPHEGPYPACQRATHPTPTHQPTRRSCASSRQHPRWRRSSTRRWRRWRQRTWRAARGTLRASAWYVHVHPCCVQCTPTPPPLPFHSTPRPPVHLQESIVIAGAAAGPTLTEALEGLGVVHAKSGNVAEALASLTRALELRGTELAAGEGSRACHDRVRERPREKGGPISACSATRLTTCNPSHSHPGTRRAATAGNRHDSCGSGAV